ncbi:MAG: hypothetical protein K1W02_13675 [Muribaculaceae bacterium]
MSGATKAFQAATVSDDQIRGYVKEYVVYSDRQNKVAPIAPPKGCPFK